MRRRNFLGALALSGTLWAACSGQARAWLQPPDHRSGLTRLLGVLERKDSAAAVGRAYLAGHPAEAGRARLVRRLEQALRCQGCDAAQATPEDLRAALGRQVRADFAAARVVSVDGWVLSETEARLFGLAASSAG